MRPNFLIIGAGKCGTTSLWRYLAQHPEIGMSGVKEPSFFSMDENWARGWRWYEGFFASCSGKAFVGEASNSYSATETFPDTVTRIADNLPETKIIYSVRHPAERTESDWLNRTRHKPIAFSEFLRTSPSCFDKNRYLRTYSRYVDSLGANNVLVLFYEELCSDPATFVRRCLTFLGVNDKYELDFSVVHGRSTENRVFPPVFRALRGLSVYKNLNKYVPVGLKQAVASFVARTEPVERPIWSEDDYLWFREQFEAPSREFLAAVGQREDFWQW